jgi:alanyl aminopeptidase
MRWLVVLLVACSARPAPPPAARPQVLATYTPPALRLPDDLTPLSYDVRLEIDPDQEAFHGVVTLHVHAARPLSQFWLAASELDLTSGSWEGGALKLVAQSDQMVGFAAALPAGDHAITIAYTGHTRHDEEGLFRQQADGRWYAFTQGESLLTRRFVPCLDEPRWKVPWRVTVSVPKDDLALGNTAIAHEEVKGARREVTFVETPAMASYLLALAVGPFELVDLGTAGEHKLSVRVAALAGGKAKVAIASRTAQVVAALEAYLGSPLPWPKLDLVVVPHLFGAMENPGLITFDSGLFDDPEHFTQTIAHELAHQWFGNSVTPAWWDDLWLSEAFASWLGDKVTAQLGDLDDAPLRLALARERGLTADADTDARPLHKKVERAEDPDNEFDAIGYEKGQAVLATFEAFAGADRWRDALRRYISAHAGGTVTTQDLLAALPDVGAALGGYLDHAGVPVVEVALRCTGAPTLELHTRDHLTVPVCVRTDHTPRSCVLAGDHTELALGATCPTWVWANDGAGYYQVAWQGAHGEVPIAKLSPAERIALGDAAAAALVRGELPVAGALAELRRLAEARDVYARVGALAIVHVIDPIVSDAQRGGWEAWLAARFSDRLALDALLAPRTAAERELRDQLVDLVPAPPAARKRARELLTAMLAKDAPTPELVAAAAPDRAVIERLARQAELVPARRDDLIDALAAGPPQVADLVVDLVAVRNLPAWAAIERYFERGATRTAAWTALRGKLADVLGKLQPSERGDVIDATAMLCDGAADVRAAFEPHLAEIPDGRRRLDHALAEIGRCAALRARLGNLPL